MSLKQGADGLGGVVTGGGAPAYGGDWGQALVKQLWTELVAKRHPLASGIHNGHLRGDDRTRTTCNNDITTLPPFSLGANSGYIVSVTTHGLNVNISEI